MPASRWRTNPAQRYAERIRQRLLLPGARLCGARHAAPRRRPHRGLGPRAEACWRPPAWLLCARDARPSTRLPLPERPCRARCHWTPQPLIQRMFGTDTTSRARLGRTLPGRPAGHRPVAVCAAPRPGRQPRPARRHGEPAGDTPAPDALTRRLADLGIQAGPERLLTTAGAARPSTSSPAPAAAGRRHVLVDDPGWAVEFARLGQQRHALAAVPRHPDVGLRPGAVEWHHRAYVTVSMLHNLPQQPHCRPGRTIPKLCDQHDLLIVEDDTCAFLAPEHTVRLSALDGLKRTIVIGLFQVPVARWRVGYPGRVARTHQAADRPRTAQQPHQQCRARARCRPSAGPRPVAPPRRARVQQRLDAAAPAARCPGRTGWCPLVSRRAASSADRRAWTPNAWPSLLLDFCRLADRPGVLFSATRQPGSLMRINFATAQTAAFWRDLQRCVEALRGG